MDSHAQANRPNYTLNLKCFQRFHRTAGPKHLIHMGVRLRIMNKYYI
ncbi:MAG: hypothetical protein JW388_1580 [Nitrospira sp.]|nr:hypothetical protein [Nitrospira sp.]